jgi:hypothetical protein
MWLAYLRFDDATETRVALVRCSNRAEECWRRGSDSWVGHSQSTQFSTLTPPSTPVSFPTFRKP